MCVECLSSTNRVVMSLQLVVDEFFLSRQTGPYYSFFTGKFWMERCTNNSTVVWGGGERGAVYSSHWNCGNSERSSYA
jgi:hypothetical protein